MSFRATGFVMLLVLLAAQFALAAHAGVHFALHEPLFASHGMPGSGYSGHHDHDSPRPERHEQCSICAMAAHGMAKALAASFAGLVPFAARAVSTESLPAPAPSLSRHEITVRPRAPPPGLT
ncbi:MAG: hypothetical protein EOM26_10770 [Alphaproteobacteria bacterium]|nr:hypothetical protein [Alphaproteobacteria bacterium]